MADACAIGGLIASSRLIHNTIRLGKLRRVERLRDKPVDMLIGDGPDKFHGIYMKAREVIPPGDKLDWCYDFASYFGGDLPTDESDKEIEAYRKPRPKYIQDIIDRLVREYTTRKRGIDKVDYPRCVAHGREGGREGVADASQGIFLFSS